MNVIKPSASMRLEPDEKENLETECLFGESVEILDTHGEWVFCKLLTDNYHGWIKKDCLGFLKNPTHRVLNLRTNIFSSKDVKSNCIHYLSLGSKIHIHKIEDNWATIYLSDRHDIKIAYVPNKHIVSIKHKVKDWVTVAEQFIGAPYKWGGRDSMGIDCSALIQLSCEAYGKNIPRNTQEQINITNSIVYNLDKLKRGHVIFWDGHVAVMVDNFNCLHSNAFHMKTIVEPLNDIILRSKQKYKIIKIVDFN